MFELRIKDELILRALETDQAEELFKLTDSCRQYLREWLPWIDYTTSIKDTLSFIEEAMLQEQAKNGMQAGIWYEGKLVGVIGYHAIHWANKTTSIGYWLGEQYQGMGIMTEACRALVNYAFKALGLNRVEIRCGTGNHRSKAIPERLGFTREGVIREAERLYDHYVDHEVYGMLAQEWSN